MQVSFIGRLGADVELKEINGKTVAKLRVAESVGYGERKTTTWHSVTVWRGAPRLAELIGKGNRVMISGECIPELWHNKEGEAKIDVKTSASEVHIIDFAGGDDSSDSEDSNSRRGRRG